MTSYIVITQSNHPKNTAHRCESAVTTLEGSSGVPHYRAPWSRLGQGLLDVCAHEPEHLLTLFSLACFQCTLTIICSHVGEHTFMQH